MQNFSDPVDLQVEHFQIRSWMDGRGGGRKTCFLKQKTGHISETVKDTAKVTFNQ